MRAIDIITLPSDVAPGTYYLGLLVDPAQAVRESNETNNVGLGPQMAVFAAGLRILTRVLPPGVAGVAEPIGVDLPPGFAALRSVRA